MRILGAAVLAFEAFVMGFALLLAKDNHGSLAIALGIILMIALILNSGIMKRKVGWVLGSILQLCLIGYGFVVTAMFFLGTVFAALWVAAIVVGRKGEAIRAELLANPPK
jgi:Protein of unknown function (DUF4233)